MELFHPTFLPETKKERPLGSVLVFVCVFVIERGIPCVCVSVFDREREVLCVIERNEKERNHLQKKKIFQFLCLLSINLYSH